MIDLQHYDQLTLGVIVALVVICIVIAMVAGAMQGRRRR